MNTVCDRDWPEDFEHENGEYMNTCCECKNTFTGHKRRFICKACSTSQGGEAVGEVRALSDGKQYAALYTMAGQHLVGEKLYTHPAATVPAGCKVVPVERIAIALESVQNAMEDAYNNAYQDCCGRGQGECCGNPIAAWSDADKAIMDALAPAQRELSALLARAEGVKDE